MLTQKIYNNAKQMSLELCAKAGIPISEKERTNIEIADFGLDDLLHTGLQLITYINTTRVCAKEIILLPYQTCPEHMHPSINSQLGKEETFRCRYGTVFLYVDGTPPALQHRDAPKGKYSVFHEVVLNPSDQYTIYPDTKHWFQAGPDGAVISEFSTHSDDDTDIFTDTLIVRKPIYDKDCNHEK